MDDLGGGAGRGADANRLHALPLRPVRVPRQHVGHEERGELKTDYELKHVFTLRGSRSSARASYKEVSLHTSPPSLSPRGYLRGGVAGRGVGEGGGWFSEEKKLCEGGYIPYQDAAL